MNRPKKAALDARGGIVPTPVVQETPMEESVTYVCMQIPQLKLPYLHKYRDADGEVQVDSYTFAFENKMLKLTPEQAEIFEKAIVGASSVRGKIHKVDRSAAEAIVAEHKRLHERPSAVRGSFTSASAQLAHGKTLPGALSTEAPTDPAAMQAFQQKLAGDNIALTETKPVPKAAPPKAPVPKAEG